MRKELDGPKTFSLLPGFFVIVSAGSTLLGHAILSVIDGWPHSGVWLAIAMVMAGTTWAVADRIRTVSAARRENDEPRERQ